MGGRIVQCVLGERQREIRGRRPSGRSGVRKCVSAGKYRRLNVYDIYNTGLQFRRKKMARGGVCSAVLRPVTHPSRTSERRVRARIQHVAHDLLAI